MASTHPGRETIYNVKRESGEERDGLCCHCSVGVCFVGFHEPRAGFGWVAWLDAAPPTGRVYSGPDHLNIVSKSRGGLSSSKLRHISKMASIHPVNQRGKIHSTKQIRVQQ